MSGASEKALPARIEAALAETAPPREACAFLPFPASVDFDQAGYAWFTRFEGESDPIGCYAHVGLRVGWFDLGDPRGAIISFLGGREAEEGYEDEGVLTVLTREGLGALIADLQSIANQLYVTEPKIFPGAQP